MPSNGTEASSRRCPECFGTGEEWMGQECYYCDGTGVVDGPASVTTASEGRHGEDEFRE